jgi:cellulose biosynthesis protein BcsQ
VSQIVTFYSFKGGVGRSMALANVAVLLARRGLRVLAVDWDLEAPGLERYFDYFDQTVKRGGLLPFIVEQHARLIGGDAAPESYQDHLWKIEVGAGALWFLGSGRAGQADYGATLEQFSWATFFERGGGDFLERLRDQWRSDFDVVLIDSRTGMSDAGGICTILMPDVLVAMFTPNYQSLLGVHDVIHSVKAARQRLAYDRMALTVLPIPSRFPSGCDTPLARDWLSRCARELEDCFRDWVPRGVAAEEVLAPLTLPHDGEFAFGERLAVVEARAAGDGLCRAYEQISGLLASAFAQVNTLLRRPAVAANVTTSGGQADHPRVYDVFVSLPQAGSVQRDWMYRFVDEVSRGLSAVIGREARFFVSSLDPTTVAASESADEALARSRLLLPILTPRYVSSSACLAEWQAFERREDESGLRSIVPVLLRGKASLPVRFRERTMLDGSAVSLRSGVDAETRQLVVSAVELLARMLAASPERPEDGLVDVVGALPERGAATVLVLPANPVGTSALDLAVEGHEIVREIGSAREHLQFSTKMLSGTADLVQVLRESRPNIVHFTGFAASHGVYTRGPDGLPEFIREALIEVLFKDAGVSVVVLSACYNDKQASALRRSVPCVVGTEPSTDAVAARACSVGFYGALASGRSVGAAAYLAEKQMVARGAASTFHLKARKGTNPRAVYVPPRRDQLALAKVELE